MIYLLAVYEFDYKNLQSLGYTTSQKKAEAYCKRMTKERPLDSAHKEYGYEELEKVKS